MQVKYTYEEPDSTEHTLFNSFREFIEDRRGKKFELLLSEGRINVIDKIVINTTYPTIITIEFLRRNKNE